MKQKIRSADANLKDETSKKLIGQLLQALVAKARLLKPAMKAAA